MKPLSIATQVLFTGFVTKAERWVKQKQRVEDRSLESQKAKIEAAERKRMLRQARNRLNAAGGKIQEGDL